MNPELITKAGEKAGELVKASFAKNAKEIAEAVEDTKQKNEGKEVCVTLGRFTLETDGEIIHVQFRGTVKKVTPIDSAVADVTLAPDLFDEDKSEGSE